MFILNPQITDANLASTEALPSLGLDNSFESDAFTIQFNAFLQQAHQSGQQLPLTSSVEAEKTFPLAGESGNLQASLAGLSLSDQQAAKVNDLNTANIGLQLNSSPKAAIGDAFSQLSSMTGDEIIVNNQPSLADNHLSMKKMLTSDSLMHPEFVNGDVDKNVRSMQTEYRAQKNNSLTSDVNLASLNLTESAEFDLDQMIMLNSDKAKLEETHVLMNKSTLVSEGLNQQSSTGADRLLLNASVNQAAASNNSPENISTEIGQYTIKADDKFSEQLTEKVNMLIQRQKNEAHIQLEPAELGRLDVFVKINKNNEYLINIVSHSDQAQHLLDEQSERLKSFFSGEDVSFNFSQKDNQQNSENTVFNNSAVEKATEGEAFPSDAKLSTHYVSSHLSSQISLFA